MSDSTNQQRPTGYDRRDFLRLGGAAAGLAALLAACAGQEEGAGPEGIAVSGSRPPLATTPTPTIDDVVLLRTVTSIHYNAMNVVDVVSTTSGVDNAIVQAGATYKDLLGEQADLLAQATVDAGGQAYEQANPTITERVVDKAVTLLDVSDDPAADAPYLLYAVAQWAAATHHAFVVQVQDPAIRQTMMAVGMVHAEVAAALAHILNPEGYVSEDEVRTAEPEGVPPSTTSTVPGFPNAADNAPVEPAQGETQDTGSDQITVYMVPSAYGTLAASPVVLGKAGVEDETKRTQLNIETPSLNSLIYSETSDGAASSGG